jgi:hypothetical protein
MKLECAESISSDNAAEPDIRNAFADDDGRGEYIILFESKEVFIQAAGEYDGPYQLQYIEAADRHFQCTDSLNKEQVESAFLKYLAHDETWKTDFQWKKLEKKPWWKLW